MSREDAVPNTPFLQEDKLVSGFPEPYVENMGKCQGPVSPHCLASQVYQ